MGQRDIDDSGVEHLHKCAQRDHHGDQPGVGPGLSAAALPAAHSICTVGETEMPSGRPWFLSKPSSTMILTGTRRTIFT